MSFISALQNQNRTVRVNGVTTATEVGGDAIYITLQGWPINATLDRVHITSTETYDDPTITVLSDAGAYRAAAADDKPTYIEAQETITAAAASSSQHLFHGVYVEDATHSHSLHLLISSSAPFTTGTVFTVVAEGKTSLPRTRDDGDRTYARTDRMFRVLRVASSGTTDLTNNLLGNGNPWGVASQDEGVVYTALGATNDKLYVGSTTKPNKIQFVLNRASAQPAGTVLTAEVWNGSTWVSHTVSGDNTSDGQATASTLSYSGVITVGSPATWIQNKIATDPMTVIETDINAGNAFPMGHFNNPARYWIRFSVSSLTGTLQLASLRLLA